MLHLDDLLDRARTAIGAKSDAQLARNLGIDHSSISCFRRGVSLPSDTTTRKLATLAKIDVEQALLSMAFTRAARSNDVETAQAYKRMLEKIAAALFVAILSTVSAPHDRAGQSANIGQEESSTVYIMLNFLCSLFGLGLTRSLDSAPLN